MIFGVLNPENLTSIACTFAHLTCILYLGKSKKVILTVLFIHTSDYLRYLRRKQTVTTLPTIPEKCYFTTL